jgi:hypothetical protein
MRRELPLSLEVPVLPVWLVGKESVKQDLLLEWKINVLIYWWGFLTLVKAN